MTRLEWNLPGERFYETGVDRGVLYPRYGAGVPWNGLISVEEKSSGGNLESFYLDGVKYADVVASEDFDATIEAFSAPKEFHECEGTLMLVPGLFVTNQPRKSFGLSYRTLIGNDLNGLNFGYKLHLVYGATASPSNRVNTTLNNTADLDSRSWAITTVPQLATTYKPTAHFVLDSRLLDSGLLMDLESYLYGRDGHDPQLPDQLDVLEILANVITEPITEPI